MDLPRRSSVNADNGGIAAATAPTATGTSNTAATSGGNTNVNEAAQTTIRASTTQVSTTFAGLHTSTLAADDAEDEIFPCENFAMVSPGVYRSAFPKRKNFSFLRHIGIRSVLTLILEEYPEQNRRFMDENSIKLFQFGVAGNKEPFVDIPEDTIRGALSVLLDRRNHPILIHCNKGKHRTGCLVGCLRKLQHWSYSVIFDEYRRFSQPKSRSMDQQFIELFDITKIKYDPAALPSWPEIVDSPTFDVGRRLLAEHSAKSALANPTEDTKENTKENRKDNSEENSKDKEPIDTSGKKIELAVDI